MPVSFSSFVKSEIQSQPRSDPNPIHRLVMDQMIRAKMLPAAAIDLPPLSAADTAKFLSDQVLEMHTQILRDASANVKERRMSYQAVCIHFMLLLAMTSDIQSTQE